MPGRISHGKAMVELMISDNLKHAHQIVDDILNLNDSDEDQTPILLNPPLTKSSKPNKKIILPLWFITMNGTKA